MCICIFVFLIPFFAAPGCKLDVQVPIRRAWYFLALRSSRR